jgi:predicted TIM-barrel fold metal-dependent hydrolase
MEDFSKYVAMRDSGGCAEEVFRQARHDGLDTTTCLRIVRQIFHLSLIEGKAVMMKADTGVSLQEHEEHLIPGLKQALQETEKEFHA